MTTEEELAELGEFNEEILAELKSIYGDLTQNDLKALKIMGESIEGFNAITEKLINSDLADLIEKANATES